MKIDFIQDIRLTFTHRVPMRQPSGPLKITGETIMERCEFRNMDCYRASLEFYAVHQIDPSLLTSHQILKDNMARMITRHIYKDVVEEIENIKDILFTEGHRGEATDRLCELSREIRGQYQ